MSDGKITICDIDFVAGTHDVNLPGRIDSQITIEQGDKQPPKCTLTFKTNDDNGPLEYRRVDDRCDGFAVKREHRQIGSEEWIKETVDPSQQHTEIYTALGELNKFYTPCANVPHTLSIYSREPIPNKNTRQDNKVVSSEIFFETGKATLKPEAKVALDGLVKDYKGGTIVIEGHCDPRGSARYNFELGAKRAKVVEEYVLGKLKGRDGSDLKIETISYGESRAADGSMNKNRRAVISMGTPLIERALDSTRSAPPDYYLIDSSDSMLVNWPSIQSYKFSERSAIYGFNECYGLYEGLAKTTCGQTPLWDTVYELLMKMESQQVLTVVSDGYDNRSKSFNSDDVISLAKEKGIIISTIFIGTVDMQGILTKLAVETGGKFYLKTN